MIAGCLLSEKMRGIRLSSFEKNAIFADQKQQLHFYRSMKYYILFGPPGAGKGTQAGAISEKYNLKHISTGELLRAEIAAGSELGKQAKDLIAAGSLVPDSVVEGMIENTFNTTKDVAGFLLDGFPRTLGQAHDLDNMLEARGEKVNAVISIMISDETIKSRLAHRAQIEGRADDANPETINHRIETYHKQTEPLIEYYRNCGKYNEVDGECGDIEDVRREMFNVFRGMDKKFLDRQVVIDEDLLDKVQRMAQDSPRLRMNYDLRNSEEDQSQRMLNVMLPGTHTTIHKHNLSSETIMLLRGKMDTVFYNENGVEKQRIHMGGDTGVFGVNIPKGQWHTFEVFELAIIFMAQDCAWSPLTKENMLSK